MPTVITGSGIAVPPHEVSNDDLMRIMDTTDEWIQARTGVRSRRFASVGTGSAALGVEAALMAMSDAAVDADEVDTVVTATMTPDRQNPGIAGAIQHGAGLGHAATFDIRQQCAGFLFGLDLADMMIATERASTVLLVASEVHGGYLPWGDNWDLVLGLAERDPTPAERTMATKHRSWSVLFGDGAGAVVLQRADSATGSPVGLLASKLHTDGSQARLIEVPGLGSLRRPYADAAQLDASDHLPRMNGRGLYHQAVKRMPEAVVEVLDSAELTVDDLDLVVAHQANERILDGVRNRLGCDAEVLPSNLAHWGNTTAATIPILFHELRVQGRVQPGALVAFTAFGAGAHWGAILYREPGSAS